MKAAILHAIRQPLRVEDVPLPRIGRNDVLVRTRTCGICRTDLHIQDGAAYIPSLPHTLGHEPAGVIAEMGADVKGLAVGQRVVPHLFVACGGCRYCRSANEAQCSDVNGIIGVTRPGGFAEYFSAPAVNLIPLPDAVDFAAGGLASCAAITAMHALRRSRAAAGDVAIVIGAGGVGQLLIQLLKSRGATVIAIDRSERARQRAQTNGAALVVSDGSVDASVAATPASPLPDETRRGDAGVAATNDASNAAEQIAELTDGDGATCVFDCVGTSASMSLAAKHVMRCGRIVIIGEEAEPLAINSTTIAQREIEIIGSRNGSRADLIEVIAALASGALKAPIDRTFELDDVNAALAYVRSGASCGRVVVNILN